MPHLLDPSRFAEAARLSRSWERLDYARDVYRELLEQAKAGTLGTATGKPWSLIYDALKPLGHYDRVGLVEAWTGSDDIDGMATKGADRVVDHLESIAGR